MLPQAPDGDSSMDAFGNLLSSQLDQNHRCAGWPV